MPRKQLKQGIGMRSKNIESCSHVFWSFRGASMILGCERYALVLNCWLAMLPVFDQSSLKWPWLRIHQLFRLMPYTSHTFITFVSWSVALRNPQFSSNCAATAISLLTATFQFSMIATALIFYPRPNRRTTHRAAITEQRKNFHQHRPASKSPSSCSASHLKSRPKCALSLHVSPNARPQHFCLPAENVAEHCIVKIFTMRLQKLDPFGAILIQQ